MSDMFFDVGDKVVYPVHGAGIIEAIENREILGTMHSYYVLKLCVGEMHVLVPVDKVENVGMRPVSDREKLDRAMEVLRGEASTWEENWNKRYRLNMDKIKSGDICLLAEVVRNLMLRDVVKGLSTGEKKMLDNARKILVSEVVLVANDTMENVTNTLNEIVRERYLMDSSDLEIKSEKIRG